MMRKYLMHAGCCKKPWVVLWAAVVCGLSVSVATASEEASHQEKSATPDKRLLLIGGPFDFHPKGTHEFMAGMNVLSKLLEGVDGLQIRITNSEESWPEGPAMIDSADAIVLFREQGARWMQQKADRLAAMERLGKRGGGCVALHFGMGTVDPKNIDRFVALFGGCHGGPDRKDATFSVKALVSESQHPINHQIRDFDVNDEFYYQLKFIKPVSQIIPIVQARIEGNMETVGWAWERENGGRSFGFSGLHYHRNWQLPEYRRLVTQAVLWSLKLPIPDDGVNVDLPGKFLELEE